MRSTELIIQRHNERRERAAQKSLNAGAVRSRVPFFEWCTYARGVENPATACTRFQLYELFKEYEIDCVRFGFEPDHPAQYGFYNTLYRHD